MNTASTQSLFDRAVKHHQAGRLKEAMAVYQQVLALDPVHCDAMHLLGVVMHQSRQDSDHGIALVRQAIALNPSVPEYHCNLGLIYSDRRRWAEAAGALRQGLALRPRHAATLHHLAHALHEMGRLEDAAASYREATTAKPDSFTSWNSLGNILRELNRFAESEEACRRAIMLNPNFAPAHNNLGNALNKQDRIDEAIVEYRRALALDRRLVEARSNLGSALKDMGRLDEAIAAYREALALNPRMTGCHSNLLYDLHYRAQFDPLNVLEESRAWARLHAEPLSSQMRPHGNDRDADRRIVIGYVSPDFRQHAACSFLLPLLKNHDRRLFKIICYSNVRAPDHVTESIRQMVDAWRDIVGLPDDRAAELIRQDNVDILVDLAGHTAQSRLLVLARKPAPVQITYLGYPGTTGMSAIDFKFTDALADPPGLTESHNSETLLRLPHTAWCFAPIVEAPPIGPLPALCASNGTARDTLAPIVAPNSIGSAPGTISPPRQEMVRDADPTQITQNPLANARGASHLGALSPCHPVIPTICFGSFNNFAKITPVVFDMWARLLLAVPDSRLLLKAKALSAPSVRKELLERFSKLGVSPDRLDLRGRLFNPAEHLAVYNQVDIALDTFPYHGTTTTCEALWMGVPVVTLAGDAHLCRVGLSLLTSVGLEELIAHSPEQYVEIAARLAGDLPRLAELRAGLRQRMLASPLGDGAAFAREVEAYYRSVWDQWRRGGHAQSMERAEQRCRQILARRPDDAEALFNLGAALHSLGRADEAVACFGRTLELLPDKPEAVANLGSALQARGEIEPAIKMFRRAIELNPAFPEAHYNLGLALLLTGQFREGWKKHEYRRALPDALATPLPFRAPRWDGSPLNGRTILLHAEQGFGDTIQFLRYVPEVIARGGRALLVIRREFERLLQGDNGQGAEVVSRVVVGSRQVDAHLQLMSLPHVLGMDEPLITPAPYLRAPSLLQWPEAAGASGLKVGLVWAGNPQHKGDRQRSLALSALAPLAKANATFFSLQLGPAADQARSAPMPLVDVTARLKDLADTADLINELDLVITVDTAIAHLAGAMGKETWILLPFAPDFRWMLDRSDSPWYPSVRLFRQPTPGDWLTPVAQAADLLGKRRPG